MSPPVRHSLSWLLTCNEICSTALSQATYPQIRHVGSFSVHGMVLLLLTIGRIAHALTRHVTVWEADLGISMIIGTIVPMPASAPSRLWRRS